MTKTWLTVDCDDLRHIPKHYGHPTRSKQPISSTKLSPAFKLGMQGFETWLSTHNKPVTLFVIADSLEDAEFNQWLQALLERFSPRVTIGCHGLNHRSWSAWPADPQLFEGPSSSGQGRRGSNACSRCHRCRVPPAASV